MYVYTYNVIDLIESSNIHVGRNFKKGDYQNNIYNLTLKGKIKQPIIIHVLRSGRIVVVDGQHRLSAAIAANKKTIDAIMIDDITIAEFEELAGISVNQLKEKFKKVVLKYAKKEEASCFGR